MLPVGPLMIEHRLIERMIAVLKKETERIEQGNDPDARFLETALDFIRTYADRLHHGKEEDILFTALGRKPLVDEHKRIMAELLEEHAQGRKAITDLERAKAEFGRGNRNSVPGIVNAMKFLVDLYPRHIDKEDHHFFLPCMQYFRPEEKDLMLAREYEFDRNIIHEIYKEKVVREEAKYGH